MRLELVRYRAKLVQLRSGLKAQVHEVMGKEGLLPSRQLRRSVSQAPDVPARRSLRAAAAGTDYRARILCGVVAFTELACILDVLVPTASGGL